MESDIKVRLVRLKKTQRWLWNEVRKAAYPKLTEGTFSSVVSGNYTAGCASSIVDLANEILSELERSHS